MEKLQTVEHLILPSQKKLLDEITSFIAITGGSGSGKTIGGTLKSLKMCLEHPGIVGLITAPSYRVMHSATMPTYEKYFTKDFLLSVNRTEMEAWTQNGCHLFFRTTKDPYLLRGITAGFAHMDEGADSPALAFKIVQARLRQPKMPNQMWVTTTPHGYNWVYHEFAARKRRNYIRIKVSTRENYLVGVDYTKKLEESYTDEQFLLQELEGEFVEIGGRSPFDIKALNQLYQAGKDKEPIDTEMGYINVYSRRQIGKKYVVAGDAATGQGEDESAFIVSLVSPAGIEEVCSGTSKMPEVEFAEVLERKSREYNNAMTIVEAAPVGKATLNKLEELRCNIYRHQGKTGWPASRITKPMMVADLAEAVKDRVLVLNNLDVVEQLMSYSRNDKGVYQAVAGARDDYVTALMLLIQGSKALPAIANIKVIYT